LVIELKTIADESEQEQARAIGGARSRARAAQVLRGDPRRSSSSEIDTCELQIPASDPRRARAGTVDVDKLREVSVSSEANTAGGDRTAHTHLGIRDLVLRALD
jgi:hypothetical protein